MIARLLLAVLASAPCLAHLDLRPAAAGGETLPKHPSARVAETVTIHRDLYGVPHVFATSDRGAYYGLGWATAEDRLFEMCWSRLMYQGRVAEFFGAGTSNAYVTHDADARTIGWHRHAKRAAAALSPEVRALLQAYADGVNAYMLDPSALFHPLFATFGVPRDPWTVADCIGVWLRLGRHFSGLGLEEAKKRHTLDQMIALGKSRQEILLALMGDLMCDDSAAVVRRDDVPGFIQQQMAAFATAFGVPEDVHCPLGVFDPHFSQALAVAGWKVDTGRAVLLGEPRVQVYAPNMFYEWHAVGATFDVRGMGIPGSPNLLCGSNAQNAWSPTALAMDQADLFRLEVDPAGQPGKYRLDGAWIDYAVDATETVLVQNGGPTQVRYRETAWGPVVTAMVSDVWPGEEYALKAVPLAIPGQDAAAGFLAMYRARSILEFAFALEGWTWPSANLVFANATGEIGYLALGASPVRKAHDAMAGVVALDGNTTANDWQTYVPHHLRPWVLNPQGGHVHSANHLPIGSWYPLKALFPGAGDNARSRRLRERLRERAVFTLDQVRSIHLDRVDPDHRDLVAMGLQLRDSQGHPLSRDAQQALAYLEPWFDSGATMDATDGGVGIAHFLRGALRENPNGRAIIERYGAGTTGMATFAKHWHDVLSAAERHIPALEAQAIDGILAEAIKLMRADPRLPASPTPAQLLTWYQGERLQGTIEKWQSLGGHGPLSRATLAWGPMIATHVDTNLSQLGDAYTQLVVLGVRDGAESMLALGESEHDQSPHNLDQQLLWETGRLKPSPQSLGGIQALGIVGTRTLTLP